MKHLAGVSVEELNKDKKGIRVKALLEHGFLTLADVAAATDFQLASIHGISQDGAQEIKRRTTEYIAQTRKVTKLRLSADNQSVLQSHLVRAIAIYRKEAEKMTECKALYKAYRAKTLQALSDISYGICNDLKWFFTSSQSKQKAEVAYAVLHDKESAEFSKRAETLLWQINQIKSITQAQAWE